MHKIKKNKGSLSIEFALLLPIILSIFLGIISIIHTVGIKAEIDRGVGKALEDISSEIYLSSKIIEDTESYQLVNSLLEPLKEYMGLDIDLNGVLNKELIKLRLRQKTYEYMNIKSDLPFWLKDDINFDIAYSSNTLIVTSKSNIKLPLISGILGDIKFEKEHIQAARGIDKLLDSENNSTTQDNINITICQYSYSGSNKSPVYHSKKCMGRRNEKTENSINFKLAKNKINKDGTMTYKGKKYRYCKFCKKMEKSKQE